MRKKTYLSEGKRIHLYAWILDRQGFIEFEGEGPPPYEMKHLERMSDKELLQVKEDFIPLLNRVKKRVVSNKQKSVNSKLSRKKKRVGRVDEYW